MKKKAIRKEGEKFFFDVNIFDDGYVAPPSEDDLPPPPVFTEEELASAKREAFQKGKTEALQESANSRDQYIAQLLERIAVDATKLFDAENTRERIFEKESVRLAIAMLQKIFPVFYAKHGVEELKQVVTDVLKGKEGQAAIAIEVNPEDAKDIEAHIANLPQGPDSKKAAIRVLGNDKVGVGACRISWADGGATRDSHALAGEIAAIMEQTLAAHDRSGHDSINKDPVQKDDETEVESEQ